MCARNTVQGILLTPESSLQSFILDRQARGLSAQTVEWYSRKLGQFVLFLKKQDITSMNNVTPTILRAYLLHQAETHNPGGVHGFYRTMKAFLNWLSQEYDQDTWSSLMHKIPAPRVPQNILQPVSIEGVKLLLKDCHRRTLPGDRDRAILLTFFDSGLRASELLALDKEDINLQNGAIVVRKGKGGKARVAVVSPLTRKAVVDCLKWNISTDNRALFTGQCTPRRLTYSGLVGIIRRL